MRLNPSGEGVIANIGIPSRRPKAVILSRCSVAMRWPRYKPEGFGIAHSRPALSSPSGAMMRHSRSCFHWADLCIAASWGVKTFGLPQRDNGFAMPVDAEVER